jgi:nucleoside-diphosphate-sugar epimerase
LVNLVTGQSRPLREILEIIFEKTGTRNEVRYTIEPATGADDLVFDNSLFQKDFPGFNFTSLAEGIKMYADEYQEVGGNS